MVNNDWPKVGSDDQKEEFDYLTAEDNLSQDLVYFSLVSESVHPNTYLTLEAPI